MFIASPTPEIARQIIQTTRKQAEQNGRNPEDILFFAYLKTVTGSTEAEVKQKYDDYLEHTSYDGSMALWCGWAGYDFGELDPDEPLEYVETNAIRTLWNNFSRADPERKWRVRDLAKYVGLGGGGPVVAGTPEQIADEFQEWTEAGVDGFNIAYAVTPGTFEEFVDGVVPVLQKRGMMQTEYQDGTLREKLYGAGHARLSPPHPAVTIPALRIGSRPGLLSVSSGRLSQRCRGEVGRYDLCFLWLCIIPRILESLSGLPILNRSISVCVRWLRV